MKKTVMIVGMMTLASVQIVHANEGHDMSGHEMKQHAQHMAPDGMKHEHQKMDMASGMFLEKKEVDGYTVSFHIMPAKDGMGHGGSHNLMVKVEQDGKALTDVLINSKVFHPNNSSESKMLMKMGDWYMAGYDLGHAGKHGIMILFKTADGKKHKASVYYTEVK